MTDMTNVKKWAIWTSVATTAAVMTILALAIQVPLPAIVAAIALVSVGAGVVGALIALSFGDVDEH